MDLFAVVDQVIEVLRSRGRVSYRALRVQFHLDDEALEALKAELIEVHQIAVDQAGAMLVWTGDGGERSEPLHRPSPSTPPSQIPEAQWPQPRTEPHAPEAERRQLTVLFCDLVDSTMLASQLDPEDLREVIRAYQTTCAEVIQHFEGYIAQYLGDGLLVYFGYPRAHEDDAQRGVRAGLAMVEALGTFNVHLAHERGFRLAIRVGIHTGLVVVGEMGGGTRQEQLALGDTPNIAARLQSLAAPNRVVISARTRQLVGAAFDLEALGLQTLKGVPTPMPIYTVRGERAAESRFEAASIAALTPLVGREEELGLVLRRWAQARAGEGQVVLLTGEPGIGKSRLLQAVRERVAAEPHGRLSYQCSPYHTNSAFYPVIQHLQRLLQWHHHETSEARLATLEQALRTAGLPLEEGVPLLAALLMVPVPERYPPLSLSPQRQKQKTQEVLVAWLLADAAQQPVLAVWEDLHWADPSTLEPSSGCWTKFPRPACC